ncbi:Eco57I restriction-modification methylase domain-containing protein [Paraburkholderia bryophila]|uniref:site-specific DNA-methyltransferase (adenine-specific) n=1 Tax=Paraburkholderia bryophila TaxID=420952 RepID=A0A7Z0B5X2_9BURK|nr:Eco57I restriction-modification methylase domain-containing protein [Paraburkholderia bryophila]NYH22459.1 adenine-specific DNA-methyltransferase [Paraburkholderia bryophila]
MDIIEGAATSLRSELGQFMTPARIASFMAGMFDELPSEVRLLDAGAGLGALSAAFVRHACKTSPRTRSIRITAVEVDETLTARLEKTLEACAEECVQAGILFQYEILNVDFIQHSAEQVHGFKDAQFNCSILNPPYLKINAGSAARSALRSMRIETTNLYAAFVAVAIKQIEPEGQLVAITPRSFCNGAYFEPFRRLLLAETSVRKVHLFDSRSKAFKDDSVLQENIIFQLSVSASSQEAVQVSFGDDPDRDRTPSRDLAFNEMVLPEDPHKFFRLPVTTEDEALAIRVRMLPNTLKALGVTVSTGRVVDFRTAENLRSDPSDGTVPLLYPMHLKDGVICWPVEGSKKPNALAYNAETRNLTVPSGYYALVKRFSSKEEKRRVVAALFDPNRLNASHIGFENKLNYMHFAGAGLPEDLAKGLVIFLNSTAVDQYFRQFSGHTQVNATDLRNLHYPTIKALQKLGASFGERIPSQEEIDRLIEPLL